MINQSALIMAEKSNRDQGPSSPPKDKDAIQPWLQLRARLFLGILSPALVSIALVLVGLLSAMSSVDRQAGVMKDALMDACNTMQASATTLVNTPHILAANTNEAIAAGIEHSVRSVAQLLLLSLTAVQSVLEFLVDTYRGLFLCFIQLLVSASLSLLTSAVDALSGVVHDLAQAAQASIQASVNAINATLRTTIGGLDDILKIIGKSISVPQISMPSLTALENVTLPNELTNGLVQLNSSIPTLQDVRDRLDSLITQPFQSMRQEINGSIAQYTFDRSILPVPDLTSLEVCQNDFASHSNIDPLVNALNRGVKVGIVLLILFGLLLICVSMLMEWYGWRSLKEHVWNTRLAYEGAHEHDSRKPAAQQLLDDKWDLDDTERSLMSLLQLSTHPRVAYWALQLARRCGVESHTAVSRLRWLLAWSMHPDLLAVLAMGVVGLIAAQIQIAVITLAAHRAGQSSADSMEDLVNAMRDAVNVRLAQTSATFANASNLAIVKVQDDLNGNVFTWLNATTSAINSTLNELVGGLATAVNSTFASTPLFTPVQSFVGCIIGNKLMDVEAALTWIQSNAWIDFTLVPDDIFTLGANVTQEAIVMPSRSALEGDDEQGGLLGALTNTYLDTLRRHRTMFFSMVVLYGIVLLIGVAIVARDAGCMQSLALPRSRRPPGPEPSTFQPMPPRSESPAVRPGHRSISRPLLPDVLSLHHNNHDQGIAFSHRSAILLPPYSRQESTPLLADFPEQNCPPRTQFSFPIHDNEIALHRQP